MRRWKFCIFLLVSSKILVADPILIRGSDLFRDWLQTDIQSQEGFQNSVTAQMTGSHAGWLAIQNDLADLCIHLGEVDTGKKFQKSRLGFYAMYLHVSESLPQDYISKDEIFRLSIDLDQRSLQRWDQILEAWEGWESLPVRLIVDTDEIGINKSAFRRIFLNGREPREGILYPEDEEELAELIRADKGFLYFSPRANPEIIDIKKLSLIDQEGDVPFPPTPENISYQDYPAVIPIFLIYKKEEEDRLEELLNYFRSQQFRDQMEVRALLPEPE